MNRAKAKLPLLAAIVSLIALSVAPAGAQPPDLLKESAAWQPAKVEDVRTQVFAWLDARQADEATRAKAAELWPADADPPAGTELLTRVAQTLALADENARKLLDLCSRPREELTPPRHRWLADPQTPPLVAANLRLLYGRWLVHESLFDEALPQLERLRPQDVVDPASLLFYQGVVHHRLLRQEAGLEATRQLLAGAGRIPRRYEAVARLMQADLEDLKVDSLDHIARRMEDVERRLALGRTGPRVRKIEDGVIESLDKLIKKLQQQQRQAAGAAGSSGRAQPSSPAPDSRILAGKGPGEVTKRNIGSRSGWGDLPPKQREEALQQIGREFPAHYRDVIEQYFRKLANQESP